MDGVQASADLKSFFLHRGGKVTKAGTLAATFSVACFSAVVGATASAYEISLDPSTTYQKIEGYGAASASSGSSDPSVEAQWRNDYVDLGMNILRVSVSSDLLVDSSGDKTIPVPLAVPSASDSASTVASDLQSNIAKMNFNAASAGYGSFASYLQANVPNSRIMLDVFSPPQWMKGPTGATSQYIGNPSTDSPAFPTPWLSGNYNHWYNGGPPGNPHYVGNVGASIGGRLRTEDPNTLSQYGAYMASLVAGFQQTYGVTVNRLSLQNEASFENPFDSMTLAVDQNGNTDYNQYALALNAVRQAWQTYGLNAKIDGPHIGNVGPTSDSPWGLNAQMGMIQAVKNFDPTLINFLGSYGANYYMGTSSAAVQAIYGYYHGSANAGTGWANWANAPGVASDGKQIWFDETGDGGPNWLDAPNNPGAGALTVALKMQNAFTMANASAYLYYQFSDGNAPDQYSLLGTDQINDPTQSKKYDAFKQFSGIVKPGSTRISATFGNGQATIGGADQFHTADGVDVSAYLDPTGKGLELVLINMMSTDSPITLDVPAGMNIGSFSMWETSDIDNFLKLNDLQVVNGKISFDIPAYSVISLTGNTAPEPGAGSVVATAAGFLVLRRKRGER